MDFTRHFSNIFGKHIHTLTKGLLLNEYHPNILSFFFFHFVFFLFCLNLNLQQQMPDSWMRWLWPFDRQIFITQKVSLFTSVSIKLQQKNTSKSILSLWNFQFHFYSVKYSYLSLFHCIFGRCTSG